MNKGDIFIICENGQEWTVLENETGGYLRVQYSQYVGKPEFENNVEFIHESEVDGVVYRKKQPSDVTPQSEIMPVPEVKILTIF